MYKHRHRNDFYTKVVGISSSNTYYDNAVTHYDITPKLQWHKEWVFTIQYYNVTAMQ